VLPVGADVFLGVVGSNQLPIVWARSWFGTEITTPDWSSTPPGLWDC
jgi:hypothetical protein